MVALVWLCPACQLHTSTLCPSNRCQKGHSKKSFDPKSTATPRLCKNCLVSSLLHNKA